MREILTEPDRHALITVNAQCVRTTHMQVIRGQAVRVVRRRK